MRPRNDVAATHGEILMRERDADLVQLDNARRCIEILVRELAKERRKRYTESTTVMEKENDVNKS